MTQAAKRLKTSSMTTSFYPPSPLTNADSPPANQEELLPPWAIEVSSESESVVSSVGIYTPPHYYSEDEDAIASSPEPAKADDADFEFSPASPPLVQRKEDDDDDDDDDDASLTTLYVFPDKTVVLTRDGEQVDIPDQRTITHAKPEPEPQPSTSTAHAHEEDDDAADDEEEEEDTDTTGKVCFHKMQLHLARMITKLWRRTAPATVEEVTVDVCRALAGTVLSAEYQEHIMRYVRCAIRQPRAITRPLR